jgi:hypothetical protein
VEEAMSGDPIDERAAVAGGGRRLILRTARTGRDVRHLEATLASDGAVLIEGQDLGPAVERIWGEGLTEYEWAWRIAPADVPAAVAALGGSPGDDPLRLLATWMEQHQGMDPGIGVREAGVPIEFWSRVGD